MTNANTTPEDEMEDDVQETEEEDEALSPEDALMPPSRQYAAWVYTVNMGGGNEGDQQVQALFAPRYQLARRGISFATSPRHANVVLLTGTLTRRALVAVQATLATVPDPRALVAVGDAALTGGIFADSAEVVPDAAELLGVNIEVFGDPATPVQILNAIEEAARLLDGAESGTEEDETDEETEEDSEEDVTEEEEE